MRLSGLFVYPVKSLRGCSVPTAEVDALGLVSDRRFMVVEHETGRFLTQRTLPRMACITPTLTRETLSLSALNAGAVTVPCTEPSALLRTVQIWKSEGLLAEDCGDAIATWLSDFLKVRCRLVRIGDAFLRPVLDRGKTRPGDVVSFADGFPFLIISEASLADLNDRLITQDHDSLPMDRFRPNLVVDGCDSFAEDRWLRFRIGEILFRSAGPCGRCVITTTDQTTGERGKEPLRTLATYRRDADDSTNVNFGQNLIHETKTGVLRIGDRIDLVA